MEIITICPVCKEKDLKFLFNAKDRHYNNKGDYSLNKCINCGVVFLNPMYDDTELMHFYPQSEYYAYHTDFENLVNEPNTLKSKLKKIFKTSKEYKELYSNPGNVLDIGCGNGFYINKLKNKGWKVKGVEPSKVASEIGNSIGLNIFNGSLIDAKYQDNEFDLIYSHHSFEHIYNPNETLVEINRVLKKDGKLFIGIPNFGGMNAKVWGRYWYYLGAPVHTFNYSPKNITLLLEKNKFKVEKINYVGSDTGIAGSISIFLNRKNGKMSDEGNSFLKHKFFFYFFSITGRIQNFFKMGDCMEIIAVKNIS